MTNAIKVRRWFYKCEGCCTVCAVDGDKLGSLECSCGGSLECMGRVMDRVGLVTEHRGSPCDHSCCFARGPNCDSSCGGSNHGSEVTVLVIVREGAIPRIDATDADVRIARRAEWDAAWNHVGGVLAAHRIGQVRRDIGNRVWVGAGDYSYAREVGSRLAKIRKLRTHSGRIKACENFLKFLALLK